MKQETMLQKIIGIRTRKELIGKRTKKETEILKSLTKWHNNSGARNFFIGELKK